jgi:hypothetical protein
MNEDGVNYLDLGDAWWHGDWGAIVNTTWSPLYAWILGTVVNLTRPPVWWEFPTIQVTNFMLFAVTLLSFEFFWRQLSVTYYAIRPGEGEVARFPPVAWHAVGYSLFIYVSLNLIAVWAVTPDMCVSAIVYLAAGQLLRLDRPDARAPVALLLGFALGAGYLAKAAMFPLGLVCIGLAVLLSSSGLGRWARLVRILAMFLVLAAPWMAVVSSSVGHPSFSDVSRFTYLKHVNGMPWPQWQQAAASLAGTAEHPPRQIFDDPPVWEFARPIGGTYPLGYDPAWWTRGLEPTIAAGSQLQAVAANVAYYFELFVRMQGGFLAIVATLLILSFGSGKRSLRMDGPASLVLWALAAFGMYALVYAEVRYVAPFVLLFWAGLVARVRLPAGEAWRRVATVGGTLLTLFVWVNIGAFNLEGLAGQLGLSAERQTGAVAHATSRSLSDGPKANHPEIAAALQEMGLEPGTHVAFVGYSYSAYWARLARLRIIAEIHPEDTDRFWSVDPARQADVLKSFRDAGASAVISEPPGIPAAATDWQAIGDTGYLVRILQARSP